MKDTSRRLLADLRLPVDPPCLQRRRHPEKDGVSQRATSQLQLMGCMEVMLLLLVGEV